MAAHVVLKVEGMTCGHCKAAVEKAVRGLNGVSSATVDLDKKTVAVDYEPGKVSTEEMKKAIAEEGYEVVGMA
ncbi:MAG: hypothetical protein BAA01_07160 [Bacillus thermozeamaize]|uniref:Copper chaperone CopZ n=1 Tax=Bacillus thermozeamaize TaxID=230954 RepID=A0A1Y3PTS1_9BACI|nr:MAG: hypothetical protein BAA01_07160 [Bacillus thermozeamaize]